MYAQGADPKSDSFPPASLRSEDGHHADGSPANADGGLGGDLMERFMTVKNEDNLVIRIAVDDYHPVYQPHGQEGLIESMKLRDGGKEGVKEADGTRLFREEAFSEGYVMNNSAMKGVSKEEVEKKNEAFAKLIDGREGEVELGGDMEVDG